MSFKNLCYVYISSSVNNTFINITDNQKQTVHHNSSGSFRTKGFKKTLSARIHGAELGKTLINQIYFLKFTYFFIFIRGRGKGRRSVIYGIKKKLKRKKRVRLLGFFKQNFVPQNGCKIKKARRR